MAAGGQPDLGRYRRVAALHARGLPKPEIARRVGLSPRRVAQILEVLALGPRSVACCRCGTLIVSAGALLRDARQALCLPYLGRTPAAPFGQRLKAHRLATGLTRSELARRSGRYPASIQRYEDEGSHPEPENLVRLAEALGVSPGVLSGRAEGRVKAKAATKARGRPRKGDGV
jgi:DNA-binding transcriptional regulator YdaS (Cro superfamily)